MEFTLTLHFSNPSEEVTTSEIFSLEYCRNFECRCKEENHVSHIYIGKVFLIAHLNGEKRSGQGEHPDKDIPEYVAIPLV